MPKLPDNYVKAPSFDNPLRATAAKHALAERTLSVRVDHLTWDALNEAAEQEGVTPEVLVQRSLARFMSERRSVVTATPTRVVEMPRTTLRAQLLERLQQRLAKRPWVQRLLTIRELLQEGRT